MIKVVDHWAERPWRLVLAGAGHVGAGVLAMLHERGPELAARYGADLTVCGVAELGGAAVDPDGLDIELLLATLRSGQPLGRLPGAGRPGMTPIQVLEDTKADILLEATPVNLRDGEPGLGTVRAALRRGTHVVLANKAPLALAYRELVEQSDLASAQQPMRAAPRRPPCLRFSATVAGALPVINIGRRDLAGCRITRIEGVLNGTTHSILRAMEVGRTFADALADAQRRGIAEADPTLDVDGHDAACKLVIAANAVLGEAHTLADVTVHGIGDLATSQVRAVWAAGQRLVLLCLAELTDRGYRLSVQPAPVSLDHPLARLAPDEMGVVYHTDRVARLSAASLEPGPEPASAAMVRDVLEIVRSEACHST